MIARLALDLRNAARALLRAPMIATATVLTLAVACAGTLATWTLVEAVFLRSLPYAQAERLTSVWVDVSAIGSEIGIQDPRREWTSMDHHLDLRERLSSFTDIAAYLGWTATLSGEGEAERLSGAAPTWNAFDVLGVTPMLGRGFQPEDGQVDAPQVAMLGHSLWQRRFGGEPEVIGRTVEFNRMQYTIVGVLPPGFRFPSMPQAELYGVLQERRGDRGNAALRQFGRLAPGVSLQQAQQELDGLAAHLREQYPDLHRGHGLFVEPLQASLGRDVRAQLLVLYGAALMVLLIAAANLASLSVARAASRRGEFALRAMLGAGQRQQLRLLLAEALLLATLGGLIGLVLAQLGLRLLASLFPSGFAAAWDVHLGLGTVLMAIVLSAVVALVIAMAAAMSLRRLGLADVRDQGGARSIGDRGGGRLAAVLVSSNFALALAVTVASILLIGSHARLSQVELGYRAEGVIAGSLLLPSAVYPGDGELRSVQQRLRERLQAVPGVESIGMATGVPLGLSFTDTRVRIEGRPTSRPDGRAHVWQSWVSHDFLPTLGVAVREGRGFDPADVGGAARPALVNAAFVRDYLGGSSVLGRHIETGSEEQPNRYTVVGVVDDVRYFDVDQAQTPALYLSLDHEPRRNLYLAVRSHGDVEQMMAALRSAVRAVDPALAVADLRSVEQRVEAALAMPRAIARITLLFALTGLLLAGIGVHGTLAHSVLRRTRELGVRRALGAKVGDVLGLILAQAARPVLIGLALGLPLAWLLARQLRGLLYEIGPVQTSAWLLAVAVVTLVAITAALLPARRAARIEPVVALRQD